MGLQRPSEPFHRVYSAPEPPAPARRPKLLKLLAVAAAFAVAGVVVFLVVPGEGGDRAAVRPTPAGTPKTSAPSATAQRIVRALPAPCGAVSGGTVDRTVPDATRRESANSTLTTCTYSSARSASRWLRVEAHLYTPANTPTPVKDAENYYDAQWAQAHDAPLFRTYTLERHKGIGDEAYRWFKADRGRPTVVGEVTARIRNAVFTVSYSEQASGAGGGGERERACLGTATAVAREVLAVLNHF